MTDLGPLFDPPDPRLEARPTDLEAAHLRRVVLEAYREGGPMTPDECASRLHLSVLTVRPRCTELVKSGYLSDTGERRANRSGKKARVLRATTQSERQQEGAA